jgi:hypothetical protein
MYVALPEAGRQTVRRAAAGQTRLGAEGALEEAWNRRGARDFDSAPEGYLLALIRAEQEDIRRAVDELPHSIAPG